jgi:hypothetical protein
MSPELPKPLRLNCRFKYFRAGSWEHSKHMTGRVKKLTTGKISELMAGGRATNVSINDGYLRTSTAEEYEIWQHKTNFSWIQNSISRSRLGAVAGEVNGPQICNQTISF